MIIHYGYEDGSGRYYVSIDAEKCTLCGACITACPQKIIESGEVLIDIEDKLVAVIGDAYRKKIRDTCGMCHKAKNVQCVLGCKMGAIAATWEPKRP
jgi:ferredoxin